MSLKRAILRTIRYGEKYGGKVSLEEVKERLISNKIYGGEEIEKVGNGLKPFRTSKFKNIKIKKLEKARKLAKEHLCKFEDVLMVGVTGSVAAGQPKKRDDIDLMIITRRNSLWLTRLKVKLHFWWRKIPQRVAGKKAKANDFCLNLWLEEGSLGLPENKKTLQSAMDLILMKPILNREKIYEKFILANSWAKKWVATGYSKLKVCQVRQVCQDKTNYLKLLLNLLVFLGQWVYMRPKMRGEKVNLRQAFFHLVG